MLTQQAGTRWRFVSTQTDENGDMSSDVSGTVIARTEVMDMLLNEQQLHRVAGWSSWISEDGLSLVCVRGGSLRVISAQQFTPFDDVRDGDDV